MSAPGDPIESCAVCGRTILAGESTRTYVTRDGDSQEVCALCISRAEAYGWTREDRTEARLPPPSERVRSGRVRRLFDRARESAALASVKPDPEAITDEPEPPPPPVSSALRPHAQRSVPQSPERRMQRAFLSFNASEHRRTVAGLMKSLGPPSVAAATNGATPAEVRITVAWELAWYQWDVDLSRDGAPIRQLAKGDEISELADSDRSWNGRANDEGELSLGSYE